MGQLVSSEEELAEVKKAVGHVIYDAMLEGGAVPDLTVAHPLLLANHNEGSVSQTSLQEHLQQIQRDLGKRAPTYLKDLIGRLAAFSDEPRLAGLVGLVVTMVMDVAYTSSKPSPGGKGRPAGSSSCQQRVWELQEVMEEYLKRCRISLSDKTRLIEDSVRLEAQLSLIITQLKTCLLGGDCDSRSFRHWACGAAFHTQMLVHLARFEDKPEPLSARAALNQYTEDLRQIRAAYRCYKSTTVCVLKCRGGLLAKSDPSQDVPEEGAVTGLTVTDRETGKSVTIPLCVLEAEIGRRKHISGPSLSSQVNLDLITSDDYAQAYLDHLFSDKGPVAELENYFIDASERLAVYRTDQQRKDKMGVRKAVQNEDGHFSHKAEGASEQQRVGTAGMKTQEEPKRSSEQDVSLKLSIVETEPEESLPHTHLDPESTDGSGSQSSAGGK
ncbi:uncharacterized protein LOC105917629 [Fundulus heteroclitus]|uniref:uncharacterized protein LOC105917629 n=1 Tax=Fundulus heteroclitus TaxID=8078 RepID=UPI00165B5C26|nr:uncharacterized protein LOC105917629 [Fundulus heteroclitus]XP_021166272.2 uncharacterized protein LOC105917629 [Fundulus heteroclitus]